MYIRYAACFALEIIQRQVLIALCRGSSRGPEAADGGPGVELSVGLEEIGDFDGRPCRSRVEGPDGEGLGKDKGGFSAGKKGGAVEVLNDLGDELRGRLWVEESMSGACDDGARAFDPQKSKGVVGFPGENEGDGFRARRPGFEAEAGKSARLHRIAEGKDAVGAAREPVAVRSRGENAHDLIRRGLRKCGAEENPSRVDLGGIECFDRGLAPLGVDFAEKSIDFHNGVGRG